MSRAMTPGQRVLGRFRLQAALPAPDGQVRWAAHDEVEDATVELVGPTARVALRPGAAEVFSRAQVRDASAPALLPSGVQGEVEGRPLASRPGVRGPLDPNLRLDDQQALAWVAWLGPAAVAAAQALNGELGPDDLVVDHQGQLRLAPAGLAPARTEVHPPRFRAPETLRHEQVHPGSGLYGLGVLLFRALSGAWPVDAASAAQLAAAGPARSLRAVRPDLPEGTIALVDRLLDPDPVARLAALEGLPLPSPVACDAVLQSDPATTAASTAGPPGVQTTRQGAAPPRARPDRDPADWAVVAQGGELTQAARRRAAALLDVAPQVVDDLVSDGLPLPLAEASARAQAQAQADALTAQGLPAVVRPGQGPGQKLRQALLAGGGAGTAALLALVTLLATGLVGPLALPLVGVLVVATVLLSGLGVHAGGQAREQRRLQEARGRVASAPQGATHPPLAQLTARLRAARRDILAAELAPPLRIDLEAAASELEQEVERLEAAWAHESERASVAAEVDALAPLVDQLTLATRSHLRPAGAPKSLHEEVRRRTAAARAAAAELSGRRD